MKKIAIVVLLCVLLSAAACTPMSQEPVAEEPISEEPAAEEPVEVSELNEEFELTLHMDKDVYTENEAIVCYAQIKYLGSETITVYSGNPLLAFGVKDEKYFDGGYMINDSLEYTQFAPGDVVRVEFSKSGGYTSDDPLVEFYKEYYANEKFALPSGVFEISANIDYSLDVDDMVGSRRKLTVMTVVTVEQGR